MSNNKRNHKNQAQLVTDLCLFKPLSMSSLEIAELCNKEHRSVLRDIRNMLEQLKIPTAQYCAVYKADNGQSYECFELDEELTLTITSGYSVIQRNRIIKQWQAMRNALDTLRYKKHDIQSQIEAMAIIHKFLSPEYKDKSYPYINANKLVNKITALLFDINKPITKSHMTIPMLERRQIILDDFASLFKIGFSYERIKSLLHEKYLQNKFLGKAVI